MRCHCCNAEMSTARKVKIRVWRHYDLCLGGTDSAAYLSYVEDLTYRWAVICQACYSTLDNWIGVGEVGGKRFSIAGRSRGDKAATIDERRYREFRRKEAAKLGLTLEEEG